MSDFRLSCYRLFRQHPLVKYRTASADGRYKMQILLIGSGQRMDTIFQEILVNSQLLDTDLSITVLTSNAPRSVAALLEKAPELKNYARITSDGNQTNPPGGNAIYADIRFCSSEKDKDSLKDHISAAFAAGCRYTVISTGKDYLNIGYARIAASLAETGSVISFICNKSPENTFDSKAELFAFGFQKDTAYLEQLNQIAYNLHYTYCKSSNSHMSIEQIRKTFEEPYNYISNLEAAMHVQAKLACCNIDTSDNKAAAAAFAKLIQKNPSVVKRLSTLEHRRWMTEKILRGYTQATSLDLIYSGSGITTHDSKNKWHTCLVPCNENSQLTPDAWKSPTKAFVDLDRLDQMSLKLHAKCGQIADSNREQIKEALSMIRSSVERIFKNREDVMSSLHSMELAISQMWQNKKSVLPIYEEHMQALIDAASSENTSSAAYLLQVLSGLKNALLPLKEFILFKDYKNQDRLLIRQIPFALTHKKHTILAKLLAEKESDCVYSVCRLEPDRAVFVDIAVTNDDYMLLKDRVSNIYNFLQQSYPAISQEYHVFLSEELSDNAADKLPGISPEYVHVYAAEVIDHDFVLPILSDICKSTKADYLDVTGGNPMLVLCAGAANIPLIAHKSGSLINLVNAPEISFPSPEKVVTVKEMFSLSGSVLKEESDSSVLSDLSGQYKDFYDISQKAADWPAFCRFITSFYNKTREELPVLNKAEALTAGNITLNAKIASALMPVFEKLTDHEYLSDLNVTSSFSGQTSISFRICGENTANEFLNKIHVCAGKYTPTSAFKLEFSGEKATIICSDLLIKNLNFANVAQSTQRANYRELLDALAASHLLIDYKVDSSNSRDPKLSFQFASRDILSVFQNSGKILEYYIYYSALLNANFDDVEMGWHFRHSASPDSADNELDIICTKGISSLFISAKNVKSAENNDARNKKDNEKENTKDLLKYYIYEISLLADHFGINARTALAMPKVDQFQLNKKTNTWELGKEAKAARKRGVYLLGKECFENDVLGEVLNRIADGREDWCDFLKKEV